MSNTPQSDENQSGKPERRLQPRRRVISLAYIDLDGSNGGIILNIGEDGLDVTAAGPVERGPLPRMRFQMPESSEWVEATGVIAWTSESKREAGIQFVNLPADARNRIRNWVAAGASPVESRNQTSNDSEATKQRSVSLPAQATARSVMKFTALTALMQEELHDATSAVKTDAGPRGSEPLKASDGADEVKFPPKNPSHAWDPAVDADRRQHARRRLSSLAYVDLGGENGGIILDVSEDGLVVAAAAPMQEGPLPKLRFQLPGASEWIEADGEVTRTSNSKREAGIRFVGLSLDARDRIKAWVSSGDLTAQPQPERVEQPEIPRRVLEIPDMRVVRKAPIPTVGSEPIIQVQSPMSSLNASASAALQGSTVPVGVTSGPISTPRQSIEKRVGPEGASTERPSRVSDPWQNWPSVAAIFIAAAIVSFLVGWFTAGRTAQNKMLAALRVTSAESTEQILTDKPQAIENPASVSSSSTSSPRTRTQTGKPAPAVAASHVSPNPTEASSEQSSLPPKLANDTDHVKGSVLVSFSPSPSIRIPADLRSQMARQGTKPQIGQLISRVDPVYPAEAEKRHIEGTVRLRLIIGPDGAVRSVGLLSGPDSLVPAAVGAARQWRYEPASVAGQPVEEEHDVTMVFQLVKQAGQSN